MKNLVSKLNSALKTSNIIIGGGVVKVEKANDPSNFLTIFEAEGGLFQINVTSGTIENPSRKANGTWYNLGDKKHNVQEVFEYLGRYGIA